MNRERIFPEITVLLVLMLVVMAVEKGRIAEPAGRRAAVVPGAAGEVG